MIKDIIEKAGKGRLGVLVLGAFEGTIDNIYRQSLVISLIHIINRRLKMSDNKELAVIVNRIVSMERGSANWAASLLGCDRHVPVKSTDIF